MGLGRQLHELDRLLARVHDQLDRLEARLGDAFQGAQEPPGREVAAGGADRPGRGGIACQRAAGWGWRHEILS
jgi:hypothetical protein